MNYSNKNILSLTLLLILPTIKLFGSTEISENWKTNLLKSSSSHVKAHPYMYALGSLALLSGTVYGTNSKVRSNINSGLSKALAFLKSTAKTAYNKAKNITVKQAVLGTGIVGLTALSAKIARPFIKYYDLKPSDLKNPFKLPNLQSIEYPSVKTTLTMTAISAGLGLAGKLIYDKIKANKNIEALNVKSEDPQLYNELRTQFLSNLSSSVMEYIVNNDLGDQDLNELKNNETFYNMLDEREKNMLNEILNLSKQEIKYQV